MIKNEREYKISKGWVLKFEEALQMARGRTPKDANDKERLKIRIAGIKSQLEELQSEVSSYETLKAGEASVFTAQSLAEIPTLLIKARIAQRLTHRQLAQKLGVSEKQIQRDEATDYATAGLNRLIKVAKALGVRLEVKAEVETIGS
jgi:HTH-type transcriptional regulator/antitoxin HigA